MTNIIETSGLKKVFGSNGAAVHALRGIDMTVSRGEFVALIGPSGSGKSTLMAILGCLDKPTGSYALDGTRGRALGRRLARSHGKIGFVVQQYNSCPCVVVRNASSRRLRRPPSRSARARAGLLRPSHAHKAKVLPSPSRGHGSSCCRPALANRVILLPTAARASTEDRHEVLELFRDLHRRPHDITSRRPAYRAIRRPIEIHEA